MHDFIVNTKKWINYKLFRVLPISSINDIDYHFKKPTESNV